MNKLIFKYILLLLFCITTIVKVKAQTVLDSMLIISVGQYQPVIVDANKIPDKPVIVDSTKKIKVNGFAKE